METGTEPAVPEALEGTVISPREQPALSAFARAAVDAGTSAKTLRLYAAEWASFTAWCGEHGRVPLPATPETVTEYTAWCCYHRPLRDRGGAVIPDSAGISPPTARLALAAIRKAHENARLTVPYTKDALKVIKGYEKKLAQDRDPRARPRRVTPFTPENLAELTGPGLRGNQELIRLRDAALMYLDYSGATRISELVRVNVEDVRDEGDALVVAIYRLKNHTHSDVVIPQEHAPRTVAAIRDLIAALAEQGHVAGPLFPRISRTGKIGVPNYGPPDGRMTGFNAEKRIKLAAEAAGVEGRFTAHSGRRGFATRARQAGHDKLAITRHGNAWADNSTSVDVYIVEADARLLSPLRGVGV